MDRLPQEIVLDILSRLPIQSLLQSKSVCRAWRCLILDPVLVNKHFQRMVKKDPTFILQTDHPTQSQFYFGDYVDKVMTTKKLSILPPLQLNSHVVGSCNGLLCLLDPNRLCIYNPFTKDYTELPALANRYHYSNRRRLGFGFDPIANQYKVVQISYRVPTHILKSRVRRLIATPRSASLNEATVHILTVGCHEWRNLGNLPFNLRLQQSPPVLVNGKLHWVSSNNETSNLITSFDLATEQFNEVPKYDSGSSSSAPARFAHVVVVGGCLAIASHDKEHQLWEIWVMKTYGLKESWSKEYSIGAYLPQVISEKYEPNDSRRLFLVRCMRVICLLRSGEILLEYKNRALVVYNPYCETFRDLHLTLEGMPKYFKLVVHVSSLHWIHTFANA